MRFSAALYALAIATGALASPIQEARDTNEVSVVERSTSVSDDVVTRAVETRDSEADMIEELVIEIHDPEASTDSKKLKERINTTSANNVAYGKAIYAAVDAAATQAKQIKNWNSAREAFTKGVTYQMAVKNPDRSRAKAAVCYNQGYRIRDPSNYYGLRSISFSSGLLKTNYDCFYLGNKNAFWYDGDAGFVNLAMNFPTDYCTWDRAPRALTCM